MTGPIFFPDSDPVAEGVRRADALDVIGALREAIRRLLYWGVDTGKATEATDAILALPALRDLIAERDQAVAAVNRAMVLADHWDTTGDARFAGDRIARSTAARALRDALGDES